MTAYILTKRIGSYPLWRVQSAHVTSESPKKVKGITRKSESKKEASSTAKPTGKKSKITTTVTPQANSLGVRASSAFVRKSGRQLMLNGRVFQSIGVNRYNLLTTGGSPYIGCAGVFSDADLSSWFSEVKNMGGTSIRFWVFQSFTRGATDFARFDQILRLANENGIKVIPVLENQWHHCTEGGDKSDDWYRTGYKNPYGSYQLSYRDYVTKVVTAYKDNPTIMMWQLINEAEADHQALYAFTEDMGNIVKSIDNNHLLSLGTMGNGQRGAQESQYRVLHAIPTIDVVEYHDYNHETLPFPDYDNFNSLKTRFSDAITLDKPMIIGESGIKSHCSGDKCYDRGIRAELFRAKMDAFFMRGGAAYLLWSYRDNAGSPANEFDFLPDDPLVNVIRNQATAL